MFEAVIALPGWTVDSLRIMLAYVRDFNGIPFHAGIFRRTARDVSPIHKFLIAPQYDGPLPPFDLPSPQQIIIGTGQELLVRIEGVGKDQVRLTAHAYRNYASGETSEISLSYP